MTSNLDKAAAICGHTPDWITQSARSLATSLETKQQAKSENTTLGTMTEDFHTAIRSRDVVSAIEIGRSSQNWPALALSTIELIEKDWQDDNALIGDIAEAYWTLRRTLDELNTTHPRNRRRELSIGTAVIYLPETEKHSFGSQLLVDQIKRIGWDAQLWIGDEDGDVTNLISTQIIDIIGLSVGTDDRLDGLADTIADIRQCSLNPNLKVMVGGSAIDGPAEKYGFLGADWVARPSDDAVDFFKRGWSSLSRYEGAFDG